MHACARTRMRVQTPAGIVALTERGPRTRCSGCAWRVGEGHTEGKGLTPDAAASLETGRHFP